MLEEVGAGSQESGTLKTLQLPYDLEPVTCLCMVFLWIKMESSSVPSVLSTLLHMLNYKYSRKLWSVFHCLALPSVNWEHNLMQIWVSRVSPNPTFLIQNYVIPTYLKYIFYDIKNYGEQSFLCIENHPTGETSVKRWAGDTVILKINLYVFETSYVYSDVFLFQT